MDPAQSTYFSLPVAEQKSNIFRATRHLTPWQKHKEMLKNYRAQAVPAVETVSNIDVLKNSHQFIMDEAQQGWEGRLAKKYYDRLFKDYVLGDLSRYKKGIGMRWRSEAEVIEGKGQFICGNLRCKETNDLTSWEVNFAYVESNISKNALVKLRICTKCSLKLNYRKLKEKRKQDRRLAKILDTHESSTANSQLPVIPGDVLKDDEADSIHSDHPDANDASVWCRPIAISDEPKSQQDEIDEYFASILQ